MRRWIEERGDDEHPGHEHAGDRHAGHSDRRERLHHGDATRRREAGRAEADAGARSVEDLRREAADELRVVHDSPRRIVPGFVVQGGDPTGTGGGGPGYQTVDKPPASTAYTLGVVAMAKTQTEAPGTSGSQFFVVTAQDAQLPPDYAVLGHISAGSAVVSRIGELGDQSTEQPTETVEIEHATLTVH